MSRALFAAAIALGLVACQPPEAGVPHARTVPVTFASDADDAWLHSHCRLVEFGTLRNGKTYEDAELPSATTFVELIALRNDMARAKFFACPARPDWYRPGVNDRASAERTTMR